ncbi:hypothetical protein DRH29_05625 [candidate division Kazan bacterium]|uniref:Uncharacterized protein n=1 Tax=candidate division Kazan bacterium TaxID=2202143 RepID=A0A420ZB41_UNCK3|nr:MAG: hypothetical protein DRH29_05625 [candidate division Kazan bacterium]
MKMLSSRSLLAFGMFMAGNIIAGALLPTEVAVKVVGYSTTAFGWLICYRLGKNGINKSNGGK